MELKLRDFTSERLPLPGLPPGFTGVNFHLGTNGNPYAVWVREEPRSGGQIERSRDREDPIPYWVTVARKAVPASEYDEVKSASDFNDVLLVEIGEENYEASKAFFDAKSPTEPKALQGSAYDPDDCDPDDCE
jgi:hypothetical protein